MQKSTILKTLHNTERKNITENKISTYDLRKLVKGLNTFARHCILSTLKMLVLRDYIDVSH